jgi:hypothetical protein
MRKIITVVCAAALATCAYAEVGSVISSFYIGYSTYRVWHFGIYRDASYVYSLYDQYDNTYIYRFTPSGSIKGLSVVYYKGFLEYGEADHCHLGAGYLAYLGYTTLWFADLNLPHHHVASFPVRSPSTWKVNNLVWDGRYYYVNYWSDYGVFNRYTPAGALVGTWAVAGWPPGVSAGGVAFSRTFNNASGRYLLAVSSGDRLYAYNMDGGSLLGSWRIPPATRGHRGGVCGDAYPSSYGAALWVHYAFGHGDRPISWAYQIDINARGAASVVPASLGKVKAIYR